VEGVADQFLGDIATLFGRDDLVVQEGPNDDEGEGSVGGLGLVWPWVSLGTP